MKKLLVVVTLIISLNFSCGRMCACFQPVPLSFNLVIKNAGGADLLKPSITGSYSKESIKVYTKAADGTITPLKFEINNPIPAGHTKIDYYQLVSPDLVKFSGSKNAVGAYEKIFFLQFRDEKPYQFDLSYHQFGGKLYLLLDGVQIPKDSKMLEYVNSLFYFIKP
ncbi:MAG: hypothetical protein EOO07_00640 [Chitinophagaceae bacterium]|nr:MAG: hypothetical protein EOO07_00640 [Chitinophagaceae bacterium]